MYIDYKVPEGLKIDNFQEFTRTTYAINRLWDIYAEKYGLSQRSKILITSLWYWLKGSLHIGVFLSQDYINSCCFRSWNTDECSIFFFFPEARFIFNVCIFFLLVSIIVMVLTVSRGSIPAIYGSANTVRQLINYSKIIVINCVTLAKLLSSIILTSCHSDISMTAI